MMTEFLRSTVLKNSLGTPSTFPNWWKMKTHLSAMVAAVALSLTIAPSVATASIIGFLGNFDVINDTGQTAYGFEIELEGLHSSDITDVFGGPGRGFPTGRGFDPATSVERYGSPSISEYTNGAIFGTKVIYSAIWDGANWDYNTPSGNQVTPGDNCWSGGGIGYSASTSCDHFGVGTRANPTKTTYSWLLESSPGVLTNANGEVQLPAPAWVVIPPDPGLPPAPPQVVAQVEAPDPPEGFEFGEALWVKVFTIEFEDPTELEDLVGDNIHVQEAETETEWQLLQKDFMNPDSGKLESGYGVPVGPNAASILRRYEFYEFSGVYDPETQEAQFDAGFGDSHPGPNDVGTYLGSQNAAVNLAEPEPQTGDYNHDGIVDAADYVAWRKNDGTQAGFDTWQAQFGQMFGIGLSVSANATVPEPATLVMFLVAAAASIPLRRRRADRP